MDAQGPALYVFAHNDDELSAFLRLRDDVRQGREVHVAWLTESLFRARPGERPRESTRAMALLGVPAERLHFLGASLGVTGNGTLLVRIADVIERLTALVHELAPGTIATTAFEGGHVEHDAAHVAAVLAARRAGSTARLVEVPWYNGYRSRTIAFFRPLPGAGPHESDRVGIAELKLFWRLVRCYPSQAPQLWPGLGGALAALARRGAPFRALPARSYLERPHAGRLLYERELGWLRRGRLARWVEPLLGWPQRFRFEDFRRIMAGLEGALAPSPA